MDAMYVSDPGELSEDNVQELWQLFVAIDRTWGNQSSRVEDMISRWREFIKVKSNDDPSYLGEYESACDLIRSLRKRLGNDLYPTLLLSQCDEVSEETRMSHLQQFVINEFIRVWVSSGGFRGFGGKNYAGFVSGSRYRSQRPYRAYETE